MVYEIERYHLIMQNTIAIVFLGTPHRGAYLAKLLKTILNATFSEKKYVEDILPDRRCIKEINDVFAERAVGLELASFWENTGMGLAGVCKYQPILF